jgi:hypothetical protein
MPSTVMFNLIQGRWVTEDNDSDIEITIKGTDGDPSVEARCISDGEILVVTNIQWLNPVLSFDALVPSNGYKTRNVMRFKSPDQCEFELTLWENWKRMV